MEIVPAHKLQSSSPLHVQGCMSTWHRVVISKSESNSKLVLLC